MGYFTSFTLILKADDPDHIKAVNEYIENLTSDDEAKEGFSSDYISGMYQRLDGVWKSSDRWKWYEHDDDMKILSSEFPEVLFILYGEGEENGDIWRSYYKNGKMKTLTARIVFDEYDPKELE
jgi:hypothetical protein